MKKILLFAALLSPAFVKAQDAKEYAATNGITYHVGDTVRLGNGSGSDGKFLYIEDRGLGISLPNPSGRTQSGRGLPKDYAGNFLIIKTIKKTRVVGADKWVFMVSGAGPFRLTMSVEEAIRACEITPCTKVEGATGPQNGFAPATSVADEIKKLKALMDSGAITKDEYEKRKKKLLDQ